MSYTARIRLDCDQKLAKAAALQGIAKQTLLCHLIMACDSLEFKYDDPRVQTSFLVSDAAAKNIKKVSKQTKVPQTRIIDLLVERAKDGDWIPNSTKDKK